MDHSAKAYNPRLPEQHAAVPHGSRALQLASAGQFDSQGDRHTPAAYVEKAFRKFLECAIFAHGFLAQHDPHSFIDLLKPQSKIPAEIRRAKHLISAIDAGGIPLDPGRICRIAEDIGLDASRNTRMEVTI